MKNYILLKTFLKLGIRNLYLITIYKLLKFSRFYFFSMPIKKCSIPFFLNDDDEKFNLDFLWFKKSKLDYLLFMKEINKGYIYWFTNDKKLVANPPHWYFDPYINKEFSFLNNHWSLINENKISDIKNIWELSRWNWAIKIAMAWKISKNSKFINLLNNWIKDWCINNPVNYGLNWMCGQEISIRLINFLIIWKIINNKDRKQNLILEDFIFLHLQRIDRTILYAESQNNNHWTSEASALFIGGIWLKEYSDKKKQGDYFAKNGRNHLEKSVKKLIMNDGTFSQYSINYHRLLLDTISQAELWREWLDKPLFSDEFYLKCQCATKWLAKFTNKETGHCPNIGGNDGAFCYQLHNLEYSNFKPSVQLSFLVFMKQYIYDDGPWDEPLYWLGIEKKEYSKKKINSKKVELLKDGGFGIIRNEPNFLAILKIPRYKFRPCQADPLHFDLWFNDINLLRDGGTYSYSNKNKYFSYFSGIKSHNSAEFDNKEPMYRISNFLWGSWINTSENKMSIMIKNKIKIITASYKFHKGEHKREIKYNETSSKIIVKDYLSKFKEKVIIRWRLAPEKWHLEGSYVRSKKFLFSFSSNKDIRRINLKKGFESPNYNKINQIQIIEVEINESPCLLETTIQKII